MIGTTSITGLPGQFRPGRLASAFSMIETVVSIMIVGGLLVVAMNTAGAAVTGQQKIGDRAKGMLLAEGLMDEILRQAYEEPDDTPTFGRESSESGSNRADYDDVDDYDGWFASPPESKDGTSMSGYTGWKRSVVVEWVNSTNLTGVSGTDTGVKRITVTVTRDGRTLAELVAIRAGTPPERVRDPRKVYLSIV